MTDANGWRDLLPLIQPPQATIKGTWTLAKNTLSSSGNGGERLEIPYQPSGEYDYELQFTMMGTNCVAQILTHEGTPFIWVMSMNGMCTFHYFKAGLPNTTTVHLPGLEPEHLYTSTVHVRKDAVTVELDGKPISSLKTDYSGFTPQPFWALRDSHCLGVGSASIQAVFHAIKVKEVAGLGK